MIMSRWPLLPVWRTLRNPHHIPLPSAPLRISRQPRRLLNSTPNQTGPTSSSSSQGPKPSSTPSSPPPNPTVSRIHSRLPRFLSRYTQPLLNAPISHVTSFLILHELTAIIPLFALALTFHYTDYLPPYFAEGAFVKQGIELFGRWFRRRGWLGQDQQIDVDVEDKAGGGEKVVVREKGWRLKWWDRGEGTVKLVVELATAWAVTKALLPLRLVASVSATPWFARVVVLPFGRRVKGLFGKGNTKTKA